MCIMQVSQEDLFQFRSCLKIKPTMILLINTNSIPMKSLNFFQVTMIEFP